MYRVIWSLVARAELAAIWNSAPASDDQLLVWAVADLAFRLERDPEYEGESRPMGTRVTFSWPLAIWFQVLAPDTVRRAQTFWPTARNTAHRSTPPCDSNRSSSMATTAWVNQGEISCNETGRRR